MSKIDFTAVFVGLDGEPLIEQDKAMTLGDVAANALLIQYADENPSGAEKVKRWALALRVQKATDADLTAEDIATLKNLIGRAYAPLIVGQAWSILDPASAPTIAVVNEH